MASPGESTTEFEDETHDALIEDSDEDNGEDNEKKEEEEK